MAERFNRHYNTNLFFDIPTNEENDENRYHFDDSLELPSGGIDMIGPDDNANTFTLNNTATLVSKNINNNAANLTHTFLNNKNMHVGQQQFNNNYNHHNRNNILTSNNKFFNNGNVISNNFVSIKDEDDEKEEADEDSGNYMDENVDSINIHYGGNDGGFKLPPRLAARLFKKAVTKPSPKLLQNLENISMPRRETIVLRSKKQKIQSNQNQERSIASEQAASFAKETEDCRYVSWINSVIATSFNIENLNVDMARIINDCMMSEQSSNMKNKIFNNNANASSRTPQIPLKDGISSIAYKEIKLIDILRTKASNLYESAQLKLVREVLMEDVKLCRFYIRKDKSVHADVGAKKHILEIFLNYNPLWLKIAIETVFGIKIAKSSKNEVHSLVQSMTHHLLSFKEKSLKKNCKSLTTYFMNERNVQQAKLHILYHFLILVHFLDVAKRNRLIDHDPCLFRTDAACKSSRDIVVSFSRDYITGVGDIFKSLRNVGIHLEHVQNPIEEFNFTVTNLGIDLRCGVRLARMAEILLLRNDILSKLYYPPNSITRKMHNMDIVFSVLKPALIELPKTLVPKDICNGYRQKTLQFLDKLIGFYNIRIREIEFQQSIESILKIQRTFRRYLQCKNDRQHFLKLKEATIFLQRRFRLKLYAMLIRNEFLQMKASALFVQRRFRANQLMKSDREQYLKIRISAIVIQKAFQSHKLLQRDRSSYLKLKQSAIFVQNRFRANQLLKVDRADFVLKRTSAIKIQRFYRTFCQRRQFVQLKKAAIFVQNKFRANCLQKAIRKHYLRQKQAAITIQRIWKIYRRKKQLTRAAIVVQRRFRARLEMIEQRSRYLKMRQSSVVIQRAYRGHQLTLQERARFVQLRNSTIIFQKNWRSIQQRRQYLKLRHNAIVIQLAFRSWKMMRDQREYYLKLKQTAIFVQKRFRQNRQFKADRLRYIQLQNSSIVFQKNWRSIQQRRQYLKLRHNAIVIQLAFRSWKMMRDQREYYLKLKQTAIFVQKRFRQNRQFKADRLRYIQLRNSSIVFQKNWRTIQQRRQYLNLRQNTLVIQLAFRSWKLMRDKREYYLKLRQTTIFLQKRFRQNQLFEIERQRYTKIRNSAIVFQKNWRSIQQRRNYLKLRACSIKIQEAYRSWKVMRDQREYYLKLRQTAIFTQKRFRQNQQYKIDRNRFLLMKQSAIVIQRFYQTRLQRKQFVQLRQSAICIQIQYRANRLAKIDRATFLQQKRAAILIQRNWKLYLRRQEQLKAALVIQRRFRANFEMQKCRNRYLKMKHIVSVIQQRYRAKVVGRKQREEYLKLRQAVVFVQRLYRDNKRGNQFKSVVIQYWQLNNHSATMIQKLWRGFSVRKQLHQKLPQLMEINQNLEIIAENITEEKILYNIINKILERISRIQSINHLHYDIDKLEYGTSNSIEICQTITDNDWILKVLIYSFNSLNRSEPHKKIIENILAIFLNILRKTDCQVLFCNKELLDVLLKIVRNFPKATSLLRQTCLIFVYLLKDSSTLKMFKKDQHSVQAFQSFLKKHLPPPQSQNTRREPVSRQSSVHSLNSHRSTSSLSSILSSRWSSSSLSLPLLASKLSTMIN